MSRILTRTKFRDGWNGNEFLAFPAATPSDPQFERILDVGLDFYTSRRRVDGQSATLNITAGSPVIPLPPDWLKTPANEQALLDAGRDLSWWFRESNLDQLNYPGYSGYGGTLYGRGSYGSYGGAPELQHNLSRPLRPPSPRRRPLQVQRRNVSGVIRPVLVLYSNALSTSTLAISYQGAHQIENAVALLTVVTNPAANETIIIETSSIALTALTFVAGAPGANQIQLGGTALLTATAINVKLTSLGFIVTQVGTALNITAEDGDEFTLTPDGVKITSTYTASINTIDKSAQFYQILEALALRGLRSQDLVAGKSITETQQEATRLLASALAEITPRVLQ